MNTYDQQGRESRSTYENKACAAIGLISYRYPGDYGNFIMIGANNHDEAISSANRSLNNPNAKLENSEVWSCFLNNYVQAV